MCDPPSFEPLQTKVETVTELGDGKSISLVQYNIPTKPGWSRMLFRQVKHNKEASRHVPKNDNHLVTLSYRLECCFFQISSPKEPTKMM